MAVVSIPAGDGLLAALLRDEKLDGLTREQVVAVVTSILSGMPTLVRLENRLREAEIANLESLPKGESETTAEATLAVMDRHLSLSAQRAFIQGLAKGLNLAGILIGRMSNGTSTGEESMFLRLDDGETLQQLCGALPATSGERGH